MKEIKSWYANKVLVDVSKYANLKEALEKNRGDLFGAELDKLDLSNINLENANLSFVHFLETNLENANLRGADLTSADFTRANLRGADFTNAKLDRANLYSAYNLEKAKGINKDIVASINRLKRVYSYTNQDIEARGRAISDVADMFLQKQKI